MKRPSVARWSPQALLGTVGASAMLWLFAAGACLTIGSTSVGWPTAEQFHYRSEVVLLASLVGAALASAGVAYQSILRNPLADPYLLGISSGAALFAYLWRWPIVATLIASLGPFGRAASQQGFAFAGALIAVAVVLMLATRGGRLEPVTLLLVGVIVNALNGSIFLLLYNLFNTMPSSEGALSMFVGGIQTSLMAQEKWTALIVIGVGWLVLMAIAGELNVAGVSDAEAEALGVRIQRLRWLALIVASLVTAAAVAISGPIGFVGLICPHLARLIVGTDTRRLLPVATALGASVLALADALSRNLAGHGLSLLPVGVLTSLLGGPFFLLLLLQSRKRVDLAEGRR